MKLEFWGLYLGLLCNTSALQTELEMQEVGNVDVDGRWGGREVLELEIEMQREVII